MLCTDTTSSLQPGMTEPRIPTSIRHLLCTCTTCLTDFISACARIAARSAQVFSLMTTRRVSIRVCVTFQYYVLPISVSANQVRSYSVGDWILENRVKGPEVECTSTWATLLLKSIWISPVHAPERKLQAQTASNTFLQGIEFGILCWFCEH
jgi:hypothetical protein